jgi:hypothetical protein
MQSEWALRIALVGAVIAGAAASYFAAMALLGWRAEEVRSARRQE